MTIAGSSTGYKHSEASIELIRAGALAWKRGPVPEETKAKISAALLGRTFSEETISKMKGRTRSEETKALISSRVSKPILVTSIETGVCVEYSSMTKAAQFLNTSISNISIHIKAQKPFKGVYTINKKKSD